jgi:uncharacterized protein YyaL (SSP411 family)
MITSLIRQVSIHVLILIFLPLLGLGLAGFACKQSNGRLNWSKWEEAYELAAKEKRIIILDVYTDWCGWCKKMDKDTYDNPQVIEGINQKFVAVKLNPEKNVKYTYKGKTYTSAQLLKELTNIAGEGVSGYPTTLFVVPQTNEQDHVHVVGGYFGPKEFLEAMKKLREYYKI